MKKYLLLSLSILSIFLFNNKVEALSMNVNNSDIQVTDENFIYYIYNNYSNYFNTYNYFVLYKFSDLSGYRIVFSNYDMSTYSTSSALYFSGNAFSLKFNKDFSYSQSNSYTSANALSIDLTYFINSNTDIKYRDLGSIAFSSNITKQDLIDYFEVKNYYKITYFLNNEIYKEIDVEEGSSHTLIEYTPPKNYNFSGWIIENDLDLTNISSDINIYGTTTYVRPDMNYSENINSKIHELSVSIIGKNVPVEFDFVYTIMDYLILLVIVFCVLAPFILAIKLLGGIL